MDNQNQIELYQTGSIAAKPKYEYTYANQRFEIFLRNSYL